MAQLSQIRAVRPEDLPGLLALYRHLIPEEEPCLPSAAAQILDQLRRSPDSDILVGLWGEDIVVSCTLAVIANLTRGGRPYALIENVVTHGDFRNLGFGKAILTAATEPAWQAGCYKVMLLTGSGNEAAQAFYAASGFEQTKTGYQMRRLPVRQP